VKTAFQEISKSYYIIAPSCWESVTRTSTSIFWDTWAGDVWCPREQVPTVKEWWGQCGKTKGKSGLSYITTFICYSRI